MEASGSGGNSRQGVVTPQFFLENNQVDRIHRALLVLLSLGCFGLCVSHFADAQTLDANSPSNSVNQTVSVGELEVSSKVGRHLARAQKKFAERKAGEAITELNRVVRDNPGCSHAFTMRALIELATKNVQAAIEDADHATSLDANDAEAFLALATARNANVEPDAAADAAEHALRLRPGLWQARLEIAKALYRREQFPAALSELARLDVDFPDVHLVRGDILIMLGRREEGSKEFEAFLLQAPRDSRAGPIRSILAGLGRPSDASALLQR